MNVAANILKHSKHYVKYMHCSRPGLPYTTEIRSSTDATIGLKRPSDIICSASSSSLQIPRHSQMSTNVFMSKLQKEKAVFCEVLPEVIDTLTTTSRLKEVPEVAQWVKKVLEYNLQGSKYIRGLATVLAYDILEKPENLNEKSQKIARAIGWGVEMLQAYAIMMDDIVDGSPTRRGIPCWYTLPDVGLGAINDGILVYTFMFHTLKTYFGDRPNYVNLLEYFNETVMCTYMGQRLDYAMSHNKHKNDNYSLFTIDRYNTIVKYKTCIYTVEMPVRVALYLANNNTDKETLEKIHDISVRIGTLFQIQDDYIDCFGDKSVSGKIGTDIQEGKCNWLAVTALQRCSAAQREMFTAHYGSHEPTDVDRIKQLYRELDIPSLYKQHERQLYEDFQRQTRDVAATTQIPAAVFQNILDMVFHRVK